MRPLPRLKAKTQIDALLAAGVDERRIIVEGREGLSLDILLSELHEGDVLALYRAYILAKPKKKTSDRPRDTFRDAVKAIKTAGASVLEVDTGRDCKDGDALYDMVFDAVDVLSGNSGRKGRKPDIDYSDEQWAGAEKEWFHMKHRTNDDAVAAAIEKYDMLGLTRFKVHRKFGPSGR